MKDLLGFVALTAASPSEQLVVDHRAKAADHQLLDVVRDSLSFGLRPPHETDAHARLLAFGRLRRFDDPLHPTSKWQRLFEAWNVEFEDEFGADREWLFCSDERATTTDVLRVIRKERVQPLVFDTQLDSHSL